MKILDESRFDFEDDGYMEIRYLENGKISFNTDMEFAETDTDELIRLSDWIKETANSLGSDL